MPKSKYPKWYKECNVVYGWCRYRGQKYFSVLNYPESMFEQKAVLDLAYCATDAMNGIFVRKFINDGKKRITKLNVR
jgi:hypothetical protein